jgi:hypothetical protein
VRSCSLHTLADCDLAIGGWPRFGYDARGGGGDGQLGRPDPEGRRTLRFDPEQLVIPRLDFRSARWLGLPLPPGLAIEIRPEGLEGNLDARTGSVTLRFTSRFRFRMGWLYRAPDLVVDTLLTTGSVDGERHRAEGRPLNATGSMHLVGVAMIEPSGDAWFDRFLGLPDEALARLHCRLGNVP